MKNKKRWKKLTALALSAVMMIPTQAVYAKEEKAAVPKMETYAELGGRKADADGFVIEEGELTKYTGTATDVVIPEGVTGIGSEAFLDCSGLTSISIPESVTSIGVGAFENCSGLTSIDIPEGVEVIGTRAFRSCSGLTSISIPESVRRISGFAFEDCSGLTSISIPEGVKRIERSTFKGCSGLKDISIPESVKDIETVAFKGCSGLTSISIPESVTIMNEGVFSGCSGLTSINIPESVTSIGRSAFSGCSGLTSISISENVMYIGDTAFSGCSGLTGIKVEEGNQTYDSREGCNAVIKKENNELVAGCKNTVIPESVESIGMFAFQNCSELTSISIPGSVMYIEDYAFLGCSGLTDISIAEGVTYIGSAAFEDCSSLTSITIPSSVTEVEMRSYNPDIGHDDDSFSGMFKGCSSLTSIKVEEGNQTYDSRGNCNAVIEKESNMLVVGCKNTVIPEDVTSIGGSAFEGCSGLTSISIPESVTSIGKSVFRQCSGLTEISITPSVTSIDDNAFYNCSKELTIYGTAGSYAETYAKENNIKFSTGTSSQTPPQTEQPAGKKTISDSHVAISQTSYVYDGTAKTPAVTVKDGNTILKEGTDYTVTYENNINAGTAKVTVTGKGDYKGAVTKTFAITIEKGTTHIVGAYKYQVTDAQTVSMTGINNKKTAKIKVPATVIIGGKVFKVTAIGKNAFKKNTKIISVEIGDNVKTIGALAFEGCTKLTRVTIGKGVTEIGGSAFKNCKKLGKITVKSSGLKKVGKNALKGMKSTAKIKVPGKKLSAYKKLFKNKGQGKKVKIVK